MNIGTLPFKNIDLKIHDMILFLMHRSRRRRLLGVAFGQPRPPRSTISIHLASKEFDRIAYTLWKRSRAVYTDIEAGKRKWKDHKLGLASSWGKGCQDVSPLFYSMPSGTKNKSPELNKEDPVGLFNPPPPLRLPWREIFSIPIFLLFFPLFCFF